LRRSIRPISRGDSAALDPKAIEHRLRQSFVGPNTFWPRALDPKAIEHRLRLVG
jgi:hypothetical protein